MNFSLRIACHVIVDHERREWIIRTINEIANPLRSNNDVKVTIMDIETSFGYLTI